jgi:hypothetical protein
MGEGNNCRELHCACSRLGAVLTLPADVQAVKKRVEVARAEALELANQQRRGELILREPALRMVLELARQFRDEVQRWPARVAPLIAADLGVGAHALQTALETHLCEMLKRLASAKMPDFDTARAKRGPGGSELGTMHTAAKARDPTAPRDLIC